MTEEQLRDIEHRLSRGWVIHTWQIRALIAIVRTQRGVQAAGAEPLPNPSVYASQQGQTGPIPPSPTPAPAPSSAPPGSWPYAPLVP